jgi:sec-independent protein translocase protein TatB
MQAFGIGLPELFLIMVLTVIVVGPEKLPEVAGQIARWIRQARQFAQLATHDFSEVISELEKEAGTSREDLREIATLIGGTTASITNEITGVANDAREATDLARLDMEISAPNVVPFEPNAARPVPSEPEATASHEDEVAAEAEAEAGEDEPKEEDWYKPARLPRRHDSSDAV